jgi:hypothetical protein
LILITIILMGLFEVVVGEGICWRRRIYNIELESRVIVINATFNNISAISWLSVLLLEETRVP